MNAASAIYSHNYQSAPYEPNRANELIAQTLRAALSMSEMGAVVTNVPVRLCCRAQAVAGAALSPQGGAHGAWALAPQRAPWYFRQCTARCGPHGHGYRALAAHQVATGANAAIANVSAVGAGKKTQALDVLVAAVAAPEHALDCIAHDVCLCSGGEVMLTHLAVVLSTIEVLAKLPFLNNVPS